jgi:hypothetical protein
MRALVIVGVISLVSIAGNAICAEPEAGKLDTARIEQLTGLKGAMNEQEGVFKVSSPRSDIKVTVDGLAMPPFMGLTSWAAFTIGSPGKVMVMGDLVLMQDEVNPVMSELLNSGVGVTALHNHFFYDNPKVYFMHIGADGDLSTVASGIKKAFDKVKEIRAAHAEPAAEFGGKPLASPSTISAKPIEDILGKGMAKDGMFKATIGRSVKMSCGCTAGKDMGVNTWAAFAGSDDNAIVDGDFVVLEKELEPVLKQLREGGINIVAIHHHMIEESPRMIFLHYWGKGEAASLAKSVKSALDLTNK